MSKSTDGTLEFQDEQTSEQKAAELAEKCARALINSLAVDSATPITSHQNIILRELNLAELVKCKERCDKVDSLIAIDPMDMSNVERLEQECDLLRAQIVELEKDKERLDWLEAPKNKPSGVYWCTDDDTISLRTAIDNAREGKPTSAPEHSPENRTTDP